MLNYEDDPKKSLKSISVKLLVSAFCAQLRVDAENEEIMGDRNGIRLSFHFFVETQLCGLTSTNWDRTYFLAKVRNSVAWLE